MRGFHLKALIPVLQLPCGVVTVPAADYCKKSSFLFHSNVTNISPGVLTSKQVTLQLELCSCRLPAVKQLTAGFVYGLGYGCSFGSGISHSNTHWMEDLAALCYNT